MPAASTLRTGITDLNVYCIEKLFGLLPYDTVASLVKMGISAAVVEMGQSDLERRKILCDISLSQVSHGLNRSLPAISELSALALNSIHDSRSLVIITELGKVANRLARLVSSNDPIILPFSASDMANIIGGIMGNKESWGGRLLAYAAFFKIGQFYSVFEEHFQLPCPYEYLDMFTKDQLDQIRASISFPPTAFDNAKDEIGLGYSLCHNVSTGLFFFNVLSNIDIPVIDVEPVPVEEEVILVDWSSPRPH